jgi:hypothetical protein
MGARRRLERAVKRAERHFGDSAPTIEEVRACVMEFAMEEAGRAGWRVPMGHIVVPSELLCSDDDRDLRINPEHMCIVPGHVFK